VWTYPTVFPQNSVCRLCVHHSNYMPSYTTVRKENFISNDQMISLLQIMVVWTHSHFRLLLLLLLLLLLQLSWTMLMMKIFYFVKGRGGSNKAFCTLISGFRRYVDETCALLGHCAAWLFWFLLLLSYLFLIFTIGLFVFHLFSLRLYFPPLLLLYSMYGFSSYHSWLHSRYP
jgi:hypothetical protein